MEAVEPRSKHRLDELVCLLVCRVVRAGFDVHVAFIFMGEREKLIGAKIIG